MKPFTLPTTPSGPSMLEPLNLCLYGRPGMAKTPICLTLPNAGLIRRKASSLPSLCGIDDKGLRHRTLVLLYFFQRAPSTNPITAATPKVAMG